VIAPAPTLRVRSARGRLPRWPLLFASAAAAGAVGGAVAWTTSSRSAAAPPALPQLHGVASWPAGARPAPAFRLHDGSAVVRSSALRGRTVVLVFEPPACAAACTSMRGALASIVSRLAPAERPAVVTVGGPGALRAVDPAAVRARFGVSGSTPLVYLLDRAGNERTGYLFPFAPAFLQGDLRTLAKETR
jgi:hypothetical protein